MQIAFYQTQISFYALKFCFFFFFLVILAAVGINTRSKLYVVIYAIVVDAGRQSFAFMKVELLFHFGTSTERPQPFHEY